MEERLRSINHQENQQSTEELLQSIEENLHTNFQPTTSLPGDDFTFRITCRGTSSSSSASSLSVKIGSGMIFSRDRIVSTIAGELAHRPPSTYWIKSNSKRYFPRVHDQVVGVIEDRTTEFYLLNIYCGYSCILNRLAFEGATKRNKPELKKGDVIYARVISFGNDGETELSCTSATGSTKEWSSGETVYGLLSQGLLVHVNSATAKRLLRPDCVVLNALGRNFVYEIAVGLNGAVWFRCPNNIIHMIIIRNAILNSQHLDDVQCETMVDQLVKLARERRSPTDS